MPRPRQSYVAAEPSYIVGIGGSAGSFDAFRRILAGLDRQTGMAFVFVVHLPPDRASSWDEILGRWTTMRVCEAEDGARVEPDCVYVIPPNRDLFIKGGRFVTTGPRTKGVRHHQVDLFLKSLAEDAGRRAIAIILSGGDGDGSEGLAAVKFKGGLTFSQDDSARIPSMPHHAQETGCVDNVLSPAQIAAELSAIARATHAGHAAIGY